MSTPIGSPEANQDGLEYTVGLPDCNDALYYINRTYICETVTRQVVEPWVSTAQSDHSAAPANIFLAHGPPISDLLTHQAWWNTDMNSDEVFSQAKSLYTRDITGLEIFTKDGTISLNINHDSGEISQEGFHIFGGHTEEFTKSMISIGGIYKWYAHFATARTQVRYNFGSNSHSNRVAVNVFGLGQGIHADDMLNLFQRTASGDLSPYYSGFRDFLQGQYALSVES